MISNRKDHVFVKDKPSSWCSNNIIFVFKSQSLWQSLHSPCRTNIKQFALCFQGPKFCNSLNIEIQNDGTLSWSLNCEHYLSQLPSYSSWFVNIFLFLLTFLTQLKYMFVLSACYCCCCLMCVCPFLFNKNILNLNHAIKLKDTVPHFCKIWGACSSHKPWFPNECPCLMFNLQLHHIKVYVTVFYFYCCIIIRNGEINKLKNYLFIFAKYEESVAHISLLVSQWVS